MSRPRRKKALAKTTRVILTLFIIVFVLASSACACLLFLPLDSLFATVPPQVLQQFGLVMETSSPPEPSTPPIEQQTPAPTLRPTAEPTVQPTPTPSPQPTPIVISINAVGDLMCHDRMLRDARQSDGTYDFNDYLSDISPYLNTADFVIGNLETTISVNTTYTGFPLFRSPESYLSALKNAGFNVLTTSNNHNMNGGEAGARNTVDKILEYGFIHTGLARSQEERDTIVYLEKDGFRIALLSYTYGDAAKPSYMVSTLVPSNMIEDIARAREEGANAVILSLHWGMEYSKTPSSAQRDLAQKLCAAGADVILGSHTHIVQPIESVTATDADGNTRTALVAYCMGNFLSNQKEPDTEEGLMLHFSLSYDPVTEQVSMMDDAYYLPTFVYRGVPEKGKKETYRVIPLSQSIIQPTELPVTASNLQKRLDKIISYAGTSAVQPLLDVPSWIVPPYDTNSEQSIPTTQDQQS